MKKISSFLLLLLALFLAACGSRVKVPKAPRPVEKLPKINMATGHTVRKPTTAIRLGVKTDRFPVIASLFPLLCSDQQAIVRVNSEMHQVTDLEVGIRFSFNEQPGIVDADFSLKSLADKHQ